VICFARQAAYSRKRNAVKSIKKGKDVVPAQKVNMPIP
jgi:hypothetical protein